MSENIWNDPLWYEAADVAHIPSPALFFYKERIVENIRRMIRISGDANRLRPHIKTHKCAEIIKLHIQQGITKFKCSTIAESEMAALAGASDVLLAMQPVGPNIDRIFRLMKAFKNCFFSVIVDSEKVVHELSDRANQENLNLHVWLDLNVGMNRTGITPDASALNLCQLINKLSNIELEGLHVYDGHIHESNPEKREKACSKAFELVESFKSQMQVEGLPIKSVVAGGTPTFPLWAKNLTYELSPGTTVLWDYGYGEAFKDLPFLYAGLVFMRVVSKPEPDLLCFDLGHKAVCDDMPNPRVKILGLTSYEILKHNEEHLVVKTREAGQYPVGSHFYGIPYHICPTVNRYDSAWVVENKQIKEEWLIEARRRKISI